MDNIMKIKVLSSKYRIAKTKHQDYKPYTIQKKNIFGKWKDICGSYLYEPGVWLLDFKSIKKAKKYWEKNIKK